MTNLAKAERGDKTLGTKALGLSELLKEKIPTPPGFVINTDGFLLFLKKNNLDERIRRVLEDLDTGDYQKLVDVSGEINNLFVISAMPESLKNEIKEAYDELLISREAKKIGGAALDFIKAGRDQTDVAVRSSPITSPDSGFPGLMETFLNISGLNNLLDSIKLCWSSLYTPRCIFYRGKRGFSDLALTGVVVQRMVNSEKSGSVFQKDSRLVIEASWGFGSSIKYGLVIPDRYELDSETGELLDKKIGKKIWLYRKDSVSGKTQKEAVLRDKINEQVLNEDEIKKIFELYKRVEEIYKTPREVEWSVERNRIVILQNRQMSPVSSEEGVREGEVFLEGVGISPGETQAQIKLINNTGDFTQIGEDIIATKVLSPELIPLLSKAKGIISEYGGFTSTAALTCRELGIPCITECDISSITGGEYLTLSGSLGRVYKIETEGKVPEGTEDFGVFGSEDLTATEIKVNLDFSKVFEAEKEFDGVGVLKPDGLFREQDPVFLAKNNPEELLDILGNINSVAKRFYPKMVWYRSYKFLDPEGKIMGFSGIRKSLEEPELLKYEIETVKKAYQDGLKNMGIVLPLVSNVSELRRVKTMIPFSVKLGIEISTPSSLMNIDSFCKEGVNLVLINLPELAGLSLGVNPKDQRVSQLYSENDSGVMRIVNYASRACKEHGIELCVYLDKYDPEVIESLVRIGVGSLSVEPEYLENTKNLVSRTERRLLLDNIRNKPG